MNRLNIPLSSTQRPAKRLFVRVGVVLALILVAWLFVRAYLTVDTTTWLRPVSSVYSLHLPMNPGSVDQLTQNMGSQPLLAGSPWTIDQLPQWCDRACSIHLNEAGSIHALSLDGELDAAESGQILATGLIINEIDGKTLISQTSESISSSESSINLPFRLLFPWNDAVFYDHLQDQRASVRINDRGMAILAAFALEEPHQVVFSENSQVLAQMSFTPDNTPYPLNGLTLHESFQSLLNSIAGSPISLSLAQLDNRLIFSIQLPVVLDQQEAATLSRELIKPSSLSTLEWTIDDGTTIDEIRFDDSTIAVETSSDGETYYMEVSNELGETVLRLTQTPENLLISNTEISLTQSENDESSCLRNARTFIRPGDLIDLLEQSDTISARKALPLFTSFSEIGFTSSKAMMCW